MQDRSQLPPGLATALSPPGAPQVTSSPGPPPAGMPPAGMPPAGMPPAGMPPAGMPPAGMPPAGMPPVGIAPPGGRPQAKISMPDMDSQIRQIAQANPEVMAGLRTMLQQGLDSGEITPEEITTLEQLVVASVQNPEMYPKMRQFAISQDLVGLNDLPPEYDQGLMFVLLMALRTVNGTGAGAAPPTAANQPSIPRFSHGGKLPMDAANADGSIPISAHEGEYVIPRNVVGKLGSIHFDKLLEKHGDGSPTADPSISGSKQSAKRGGLVAGKKSYGHGGSVGADPDDEDNFIGQGGYITSIPGIFADDDSSDPLTGSSNPSAFGFNQGGPLVPGEVNVNNDPLTKDGYFIGPNEGNAVLGFPAGTGAITGDQVSSGFNQFFGTDADQAAQDFHSGSNAGQFATSMLTSPQYYNQHSWQDPKFEGGFTQEHHNIDRVAGDQTEGGFFTGTPSTQEDLIQLYNRLLGRDPSDVAQGWLTGGNAPEGYGHIGSTAPVPMDQLEAGIIGSQEFRGIMDPNSPTYNADIAATFGSRIASRDDMLRLYQSNLQRIPGDAAQNWLTNADGTPTGITFDDLQTGLRGSTEFGGLYGPEGSFADQGGFQYYNQAAGLPGSPYTSQQGIAGYFPDAAFTHGASGADGSNAAPAALRFKKGGLVRKSYVKGGLVKKGYAAGGEVMPPSPGAAGLGGGEFGMTARQPMIPQNFGGSFEGGGKVGQPAGDMADQHAEDSMDFGEWLVISMLGLVGVFSPNALLSFAVRDFINRTPALKDLKDRIVAYARNFNPFAPDIVDAEDAAVTNMGPTPMATTAINREIYDAQDAAGLSGATPLADVAINRGIYDAQDTGALGPTPAATAAINRGLFDAQDAGTGPLSIGNSFGSAPLGPAISREPAFDQTDPDIAPKSFAAISPLGPIHGTGPVPTPPGPPPSKPTTSNYPDIVGPQLPTTQIDLNNVNPEAAFAVQTGLVDAADAGMVTGPTPAATEAANRGQVDAADAGMSPSSSEVSHGMADRSGNEGDGPGSDGSDAEGAGANDGPDSPGPFLKGGLVTRKRARKRTHVGIRKSTPQTPRHYGRFNAPVSA